MPKRSRATSSDAPLQVTVDESPQRAKLVSTSEAACSHLDTVAEVTPSSQGCEECLLVGGRWVHLRLCMACGHVGCCDSSPNRHATAHWRAHSEHPLVRSYEPGEDWWWCYVDELVFELNDAPPAPSHP